MKKAMILIVRAAAYIPVCSLSSCLSPFLFFAYFVYSAVAFPVSNVAHIVVDSHPQGIHVSPKTRTQRPHYTKHTTLQRDEADASIIKTNYKIY